MIEYRNAEGKSERLPTLARELVALKVDVIAATNTPGAKAAQEATKTIPIVFITAQGDKSLRPRLLAAGAVACLFKPFSDTALLEAIEAGLGTK